jgi:hypothetical protein
MSFAGRETPNMQKVATPRDALAFVREHGVVLASAKGPAPRLAEAIAGEAIRGSWWTHPRGHLIYSILAAVKESDQVLVCRLVNRKITLVHRDLWPSVVHLAARFAPEQLARVAEQHTQRGHHVTHSMPFPEWVPPDVCVAAHNVDEAAALAILGAWIAR